MSNNAYSRSRLKRSLVHFGLGRGAAAFLGIALLLLLVRFLPAESYGHYIALAATLEIVQLCSSFGLIVIAYRYLPELRSARRHTTLKSITWRLLRWRVISIVLGTCIALLATHVFQSLGWVLWPWKAALLFSLVIFFEGTARFIDVVFDSLLLQGAAQLSIILRNGLRAGGLACALWTDVAASRDPLLIWIWIESAASAVGLVVAALLLKKNLSVLDADANADDETGFSLTKIRGFVLPTFAAQIMGLAQGPDTTKILFVKLAGPLQVAAFGFASSLHSMAQRYLPVFLLIGVIRPMFVARAQQGDSPSELSALASMVAKLNLMLLLPMLVWVCISGDQIVATLAGDRFPQADSFLTMLFLLLILQAFHAVLGLLLMVAEDGWANFRACVAGLLVFLIGCTLASIRSPELLPAALIGAELAWCTFVVCALKHKGFTLRGMGSGYIRLALASLLGAAAGLLVDSVLESPAWLEASTSAATVAATFLIAAAIFKPFTLEERDRINSLLPKPLFIW